MKLGLRPIAYCNKMTKPKHYFKKHSWFSWISIGFLLKTSFFPKRFLYSVNQCFSSCHHRVRSSFLTLAKQNAGVFNNRACVVPARNLLTRWSGEKSYAQGTFSPLGRNDSQDWNHYWIVSRVPSILQQLYSIFNGTFLYFAAKFHISLRNVPWK